MFLNLIPVVSFIVLSIFLLFAGKAAAKGFLPAFIASKGIASVFGTIVLVWGLVLFYSNLNYFIYQIFKEPADVAVRFVVVLYFISVGSVLIFGSYGRKLVLRKSAGDPQKQLLLDKNISDFRLLLGKIGILLLAFYLINYLFM